MNKDYEMLLKLYEVACILDKSRMNYVNYGNDLEFIKDGTDYDGLMDAMIEVEVYIANKKRQKWDGC